MSLISIGFISLLLVFLALGLGVGQFIFNCNNSIKHLRHLKKEYELMGLEFDKVIRWPQRAISFNDLGFKRLEEVTSQQPNEAIKHHVLKKVFIVVWHQEKYLSHLFKELRLVSLVTFVIMLIASTVVGISHSSEIKGYDGLAYLDLFIGNIVKSFSHIIPIIEISALILIILKIWASISSINDLIDYE